jgi:hypothetical protein
MIRGYSRYNVAKFQPYIDVLTKEKSVAIDNTGYDKYFLLLSNSLQADTDFDVKEDATKSQIKSAFRKSLASKKVNKKVLNEFIKLIA